MLELIRSDRDDVWRSLRIEPERPQRLVACHRKSYGPGAASDEEGGSTSRKASGGRLVDWRRRHEGGPRVYEGVYTKDRHTDWLANVCAEEPGYENLESARTRPCE